MELKDFAEMLDGRQYGSEITDDEEALAKELGFVVVLYCIGIVCDINKPKSTNANCIRTMSDKELANFLVWVWPSMQNWQTNYEEVLEWLQQPIEEDDDYNV